METRTPAEQEIHRLRNVIYSMSLSLQGITRMLDKGNISGAQESLARVITEVSSHSMTHETEKLES